MAIPIYIAMPNWCHNVITVLGSVQLMAKYYGKLTTDTDGKHLISFQKTVPVDEKVVKPGKHELYRQIKTWGTKWDIGNEQEVLEETRIKHVVRVNTAYDPPIEWARNLSETFGVYVSVAYIEAGNGIYGVYETSDGEKYTKTKVYAFLDNDLVDDGTICEAKPESRLEKFMKKHGLVGV